MRRGFFLGVWLFLLFTVSRGEPAPFPLQKGDFWVYQGIAIRGLEKDKISVKTLPLNWRCEVIDSEQGGIALVRGFPLDLPWRDPAKPVDSLIINAGLKYYKLAPDDPPPDAAFDRLVDKIRTGKLDPWAEKDQLNRTSLFLDCPLAVGKILTDDHNLPALFRGGEYNWYVESVEPFDFSAIKGLKSGQNLQKFDLAFRTRPDDCEFSFVPGVGIVTYAYHHHGTPQTIEMHLVEAGLK